MKKTNKRTQQDRLLDKIFLQPWFLPDSTARAILRLVPPLFVHKMSAYFEDYGCLKCGTRKAPHRSNALCGTCNQIVKQQFAASLKKRALSVERSLPMPFNRVEDARRLLSDLVPQSRRPGPRG